MKLNEQTVRGLTIPEGKSELIVFDEDLPSFGLRIRAGGKRTWICQYRIGKKQRRVTVGSLAAKSAAKARGEAKNILAKVQLGQDPQTEKFTNRDKASTTLSFVVARYLEIYAPRYLKPRTQAEVKRSLESHWAPLGEAPIDGLTRGAISRRLDEIASESGPFAANRARAYLSGLYSWAVERGYADDNPVRFTGRPVAEASRDRVLSDAELTLVYQHAGGGDYGDAVRLLTLTGQRREEVGGMLWSEIDLDGALWSIGAARTKNGLPHDVPLNAAAVAILRRRVRRKGRDLVFGSGAGGFSGWSKSKSALDHRITAALKAADPDAEDMKKPWRVHDLRRTAVTRMADLGVLPHVVEAITNHISGSRAGVAGVYNRSVYAAEKRAAVDLWGAHVMRQRRLQNIARWRARPRTSSPHLPRWIEAQKGLVFPLKSAVE
jgi:integrase